MSRSMRSFTVHPAPLRSKDPQPNSNIILKSGKCPGIAAKLIDLNRTNYTWNECIFIQFIELKAIKLFFFSFSFFCNLPHTRPSKEPSPNGLIEASETSIRLNMFRQIQVNPRSRHHRLGSITITIIIVIVLFLDAACWNVGKGSKIATEFEDFRGGSEGVGIIRVRDWDLVKGSSSSRRRRRRRR